MVLLLMFIGIVQAQTYKFAVLCDTRSNANQSGSNGVNVSAVKAVCMQLQKKGAKFVLLPGDLICGNVKWYAPKPPPNSVQYQTFLKAASSQGVGLPGSGNKITLYPVRGNHEVYSQIEDEKEIKKSWLDNIGNKLPKNGSEDEIGFSYSFTYKNALFIGSDQYMHVDSTTKKGIGQNLDWIKSVLKRYPDEKHVFVFGHTPAFIVKHEDCLAEDPAERNEFMRFIQKRSGVYFCGHDHFYSRSNVPVYGQDNKTIESYIQQITTPSGAPFLGDFSEKWNGKYKNPDVIAESYIDNSVGFLLVTIEDDKVTVEFIATPDACLYFKDSSRKYHYFYNDNWEKWDFVTMDKFSYSIQ